MSDFARRKNDVFNSLECAEKTMITKDSILDQSSGNKDFLSQNQNNTSKQYNISKNFRGKKESIFKTPALPISKCLKPRSTPDYKSNPQKWKKYSLADVDISDQSNISAAFDFMRAIESQKEKDLDLGFDNEQKEFTGKIKFNKSANVKRSLRTSKSEEESDKPKLKGSKLVMPEYVVGQRVKPTPVSNKKEKVPKDTKQMLSLSHLMEDEDE
ncbi:hypothetical protein ACFFRR_008167 [Megaselia abdita]